MTIYEEGDTLRVVDVLDRKNAHVDVQEGDELVVSSTPDPEYANPPESTYVQGLRFVSPWDTRRDVLEASVRADNEAVLDVWSIKHRVEVEVVEEEEDLFNLNARQAQQGQESTTLGADVDELIEDI